MAGRKIDDHSFWAGSKSKDSVFPKGVKTKHFESAEGAGAIADYPDTIEDIKRDQEAAIRKAEGRKLKPGYRY